MQILCPECLAPLIPEDDSRARCPQHGAFRILFARHPVEAPAPPLTTDLLIASPAAPDPILAEPSSTTHEINHIDNATQPNSAPSLLDASEIAPPEPVIEPDIMPPAE